MNDLRTMFGQMLGQTPLDEEEFAKLDRLKRLWYYPVPRQFFDNALKPSPYNTMRPGGMDMPPQLSNYQDNMARLDSKQREQSELRDLFMRSNEALIGRKLTPEQKRWLFDRQITEPSIREYEEQRKRPRDI